MMTKIQSRRAAATLPGNRTVTVHLRRKCASRSHAGSSCECENCKIKNWLQRQASADAAPASIPRVVQEGMQSSGQPLDTDTRAFMEPRFGHDFSRVRVHTSEKAAESARAVDAQAYTVGNNVVFESGKFAPRTLGGLKLLAHELAHVVQQEAHSAAYLPQVVTQPHDLSEREADQAAETLTSQKSPAALSHLADSQLMRKLQVKRPAQMIPNPGGKGLRQTNSETVEQYLRTLAQGSGAKVDRTSGEVSVSTAYCPGLLGGLVQGATAGYEAGAGLVGHVPVLAQVFGLVGGLIGGIYGAFAGLFGSETPSRAASSSTPTGSTCLCDFVNGSNVWTIEIDDSFVEPATLDGGRIVTVSPNSPKIWGAATMKGRLETVDPWLVLGHELCGHAWLKEHNLEETRGGPQPIAFRDDKGQLRVVGGPVRGDQPGPHGHERSVERENLLRQEHGLMTRGYRLKDPYCGESFFKERGGSQSKPTFPEEHGYPGFKTLLEQCKFLRDQLPESKVRHYDISEPIP